MPLEGAFVGGGINHWNQSLRRRGAGRQFASGQLTSGGVPRDGFGHVRAPGPPLSPADTAAGTLRFRAAPAPSRSPAARFAAHCVRRLCLWAPACRASPNTPTRLLTAGTAGPAPHHAAGKGPAPRAALDGTRRAERRRRSGLRFRSPEGAWGRGGWGLGNGGTIPASVESGPQQQGSRPARPLQHRREPPGRPVSHPR